jgi:hypothetical protein
MNPTDPAPALDDLVRQLIRTADTAHPGWEWALMMNPETFAIIDPPEITIKAPTPGYLPRRAPVFAGAEVYAMPMLHEIVACTPLQQDSDQRHVPPAYYLLLETGTITTEPPTAVKGPP